MALDLTGAVGVCPPKPPQEKLSNHERTQRALKAVSRALDRDISTLTCEIVGSTYIGDKEDSDVDVLVLIEDGESLEEMVYAGWTYGGSKSPRPDCWVSWKRHADGVDVNMLIVTDKQYYNQWLTAAEVCRFMHLQGVKFNSGTVHGIHEIIMDDSDAESEQKIRNYGSDGITGSVIYGS